MLTGRPNIVTMIWLYSLSLRPKIDNLIGHAAARPPQNLFVRKTVPILVRDRLDHPFDLVMRAQVGIFGGAISGGRMDYRVRREAGRRGRLLDYGAVLADSRWRQRFIRIGGYAANGQYRHCGHPLSHKGVA